MLLGEGAQGKVFRATLSFKGKFVPAAVKVVELAKDAQAGNLQKEVHCWGAPLLISSSHIYLFYSSLHLFFLS